MTRLTRRAAGHYATRDGHYEITFEEWWLDGECECAMCQGTGTFKPMYSQRACSECRAKVWVQTRNAKGLRIVCLPCRRGTPAPAPVKAAPAVPRARVLPAGLSWLPGEIGQLLTAESERSAA